MSETSDDDASTPTTQIGNRKYKKTPLFSASHAARYQRQDLIRSFQKETDRQLLCYIGGEAAQIARRDVCGFVDLVHNLHAGDQIDLMLHSQGGDIDTAEKLIRLVRSKIGNDGNIRAIVPDYAKSAATLIAIGADIIMMSDSSELGAIDPQFPLSDGRGNEHVHSVKRYLATYEEWEKALRKDPDDPVARLMLDKFDPVVVKKFRSIDQRAQQLADSLLIRKGGDYTKISTELLNIDKWHSHNQMIGAEDALEIGLDIEQVESDSPIWGKVWEIYSHQHLALDDDPSHKLYESAFVSLQY